MGDLWANQYQIVGVFILFQPFKRIQMNSWVTAVGKTVHSQIPAAPLNGFKGWAHGSGCCTVSCCRLNGSDTTGTIQMKKSFSTALFVYLFVNIPQVEMKPCGLTVVEIDNKPAVAFQNFSHFPNSFFPIT